MALIREGEVVNDQYQDASKLQDIPTGSVIVSLEQWQTHKYELASREAPVGVRLRSDEPPDNIVDDLSSLAVVALDFPAFRDGRAYSYARILRDRYHYSGEVRAVGEVLLEQLHYMHRSGFNAFAVSGDSPLEDWKTATADLSVWYQPSSDSRPTALQLRHKK
jgi:uncharacterized protein (DUF934 family)